jgi:hypothetical protein
MEAMEVLRSCILNGYLFRSFANSSSRLMVGNTSNVDFYNRIDPTSYITSTKIAQFVEQPSLYILELSYQDSNETKVIMSSHHFFSCSKIQELDMVMTSNLTGEKGAALKISTPLPRRGKCSKVTYDYSTKLQ